MSARAYQPLPNLAFDLCLSAVLGRGVLMTYLAVRRFLWTKPANDSPMVRAFMRERTAVAYVSQTKLAASLGYDRRQTVSEKLRVSRTLGWHNPVRDKSGGKNIYVLGKWGVVPQDPEKSCSKPKFRFEEWCASTRSDVLDNLGASGTAGRRLADFEPHDRIRALRNVLLLKHGPQILSGPARARVFHLDDPKACEGEGT